MKDEKIVQIASGLKQVLGKDWVDFRAPKGADSCVFGMRVGDMTHEDLCALIWWMHEGHEESKKVDREYISFLKGCKGLA